MINIPMSIDLDTSGAQQQLGSFIGSVANSPIVSESNTPAITGNSENQGLAILSNQVGTIPQRLSEIVDYIKKMSESTEKIKSVLVNQFEKNADDISNLRSAGSSSIVTPQWLKDDKALVSSARDVSNEINTALRGDVGGFAINGLNNIGTAALNANTLAKLGGGTPSKLLAGLGIGAIVAALAAGTVKQLEGNYEDALPGIDTVLSNFGGDAAATRGAKGNANYGLSLWTDLVSKNRGTGLSNDEFVSLVGNLGAYGINDVSRAGDIAAQSSKWSRYTGVDSSSALNFAGLIERYGGNGTEALSSAYAASRASGLGKNQFGEFLTGLQSVIENGISRGFVKSADDVASQLTMLANLSGNSDLWKGQQGANRYNTMVSAMENNTSLSTASSLLMFKAVQQSGTYGSWVDVLSGMEKGDLSESFLTNLRSNVNTAYGGDRASMISSYKEMFGLNWTGATDVYNMLETLASGGVPDRSLEDIIKNPEMKSDTTRLADAVSEMNQMLVNIGQGSFEIKVGGIEAINTSVSGIYNTLVADNYKDMAADILGRFFDDDEVVQLRNLSESYKYRLENPLSRDAAIAELDNLASLSDEDAALINMGNYFNGGNATIPKNIPMSLYAQYLLKTNGIDADIGDLVARATPEVQAQASSLFQTREGINILVSSIVENLNTKGNYNKGYMISEDVLTRAIKAALDNSDVTITEDTQPKVTSQNYYTMMNPQYAGR